MGIKYKFNGINSRLDMVGDGGAEFTNEQKEAINWVIEQQSRERKAAAQKLFVIKTDVEGETFYADEKNTTTMTVTVTLTFNGYKVDADKTPVGWIKTANETGEYTRSISDETGGLIPSTTFTYTVGKGEYEGIILSKSSEAKSIVCIYPAYHGFAIGSSAQDLTDSIVSSFTRTASNMIAETYEPKNKTGNTAYYWILTHGTADAVQLTKSILQEPILNIEFTSPIDPTITMRDYKLYISKLTIGKNTSLDGLSLTLNL